MNTTHHQAEPEHSEPGKARLLLSSLAEFWSVIEPLLLAAAPKNLCEIGIGPGEFTRALLEFCRRNGCRYSGVDPTAEVALLQSFGAGQAEFFKRSSLSVLPELPAHDVYFVDGDHNYYTVLHELRLIANKPPHWPLILLHDVGWPWGRRDQYCSPESIPQPFRHPCSTSLGVMPGWNRLGPGGFAGETSHYPYAAAEHEGGPKNGVLTAVEDFLREQPDGEWKLVTVPVVFGLGILYAPGKCRAAVAEQLGRLETSLALWRPLLELLERNRVDLLMNHLGQTDHAAGLHRSYQELHDHSEALLSNYRDLERHAHALQKAYDQLRDSLRR